MRDRVDAAGGTPTVTGRPGGGPRWLGGSRREGLGARGRHRRRHSRAASAHRRWRHSPAVPRRARPDLPDHSARGATALVLARTRRTNSPALRICRLNAGWDEQPGRGPAEVELLGNRHERTQMPQLDRARGRGEHEHLAATLRPVIHGCHHPRDSRPVVMQLAHRCHNPTPDRAMRQPTRGAVYPAANGAPHCSAASYRWGGPHGCAA
jgi:hypothetical protein